MNASNRRGYPYANPEFDDLKQGLQAMGLPADYEPGSNEVEHMRTLVPKNKRAGFQTWACGEVTRRILLSTPIPPGFVRVRLIYKKDPNIRSCMAYNVLQDDAGREYMQCIMPWVIYSRLSDCDDDRLPWKVKSPKKRQRENPP